MALFIFSIIFAVAALAALVTGVATGRVSRREGLSGYDHDFYRAWSVGGFIAAPVLLLIAVGMFLGSSLVTISTQDIGVKTAFGRTVGEGLKPGLHFKAPWQKIHRLDFKQQTDTYASNGFNGSTQSNAQGGCINVRIARQATACVNLSIRWQNDSQGVDYLFQNFKTDDNIRNQLLHRDLQAAVNVAFAHYDPLGIDAKGDSTQPTNAQLGDAVEKALQVQVGQYLRIVNVYIPLFNFDNDTQSRLNQLQLQVAQTRIAVQAEQTATAQATANRALAASVSHSPNVLTSKCLDILSEALQKGKDLPPAFSCFPSQPSASVAVR